MDNNKVTLRFEVGEDNPNKEINPTIRVKKMLYKGYNTYFKLDGEIYFDKSFLKNNCKSNISKV